VFRRCGVASVCLGRSTRRRIARDMIGTSIMGGWFGLISKIPRTRHGQQHSFIIDVLYIVAKSE